MDSLFEPLTSEGGVGADGSGDGAVLMDVPVVDESTEPEELSFGWTTAGGAAGCCCCCCCWDCVGGAWGDGTAAGGAGEESA